MGAFFNMDGPFARFGNLVADVMILSCLWILFSLPVVTIGASTTALFYVATKRLSNVEGYIMRDFWKSFKMNFKTSTAVWLLTLVLAFIISINLQGLELETMAALKPFLLPIQLCFILELIMLSIYIYPIIARFDVTFLGAIKTAFVMANKHIFTTLMCLCVGGLVIFTGLVTIAFFIVGMGVYAFGASYFLVRVFKKYRPELDGDAV